MGELKNGQAVESSCMATPACTIFPSPQKPLFHQNAGFLGIASKFDGERSLAAYRWDGESELNPANFVSMNTNPVYRDQPEK